MNWGKDGFKYQAPPGYKSIHDWIEKYRPTAKPVLRRTVSESSASDVGVIHLMRPCSGIYQISVEEGTEWRPISKPKDNGRLVSEHGKSKYTATILYCARDAKRVVVVVRVKGSMRFGPLQNPEHSQLNGKKCTKAIVRKTTSHDTFLEAALVYDCDTDKDLEFQYGQDGYSKVTLSATVENDVTNLIQESIPYTLVKPTRDMVYPTAVSDIMLCGTGTYAFECTCCSSAKRENFNHITFSL